jgi:hypothetical protein
MPHISYDPAQLDDYCKINGYAHWFETSVKMNINLEGFLLFLYFYKYILESVNFLVEKILEAAENIEEQEKKSGFYNIVKVVLFLF